MTRSIALVAALGLAGCFASHPGDRQELMGEDCYACHKRDYVATAAPVHGATPAVFSTACANCHRTVSWAPALEGLHSDVFLLATGAHAPIACLGCHALDLARTSRQGANTNCIQCHPDDVRQREQHDGVTSVTSQPYAYLASVPNFCLQCHPAGTAIRHPDNLFARRDHHAVPCIDCHDRKAGPDTLGRNVTCVDAKCHHTLGFSDSIGSHRTTDYRAARGDGASRNFCHQCHR